MTIHCPNPHCRMSVDHAAGSCYCGATWTVPPPPEPDRYLYLLRVIRGAWVPYALVAATTTSEARGLIESPPIGATTAMPLGPTKLPAGVLLRNPAIV